MNILKRFDFLGIFGAKTPLTVTPLSETQHTKIHDWKHLPITDLSLPHEAQRYVVVDVESSGLNMKKDRLISIGAVGVTNARIDFKDSFQVILKQEKISDHDNILIHGIGGSTQSEGVEPADALIAFLQYVGKSPLVAYHAFFDAGMIDKAMQTYLGMKITEPWIDLAWILPHFFDFRKSARVALDDYLHFFNIENLIRHNAVSDAYATAKLLQIVIAAGNKKGDITPKYMMGIEKSRRFMYDSRYR